MLTRVEWASLLRDVLPDDLADIVLGWHLKNIQHGRRVFFNYRADARCNDTNPCALDLLAIPVEEIAAWLDERGITVPTVAQCRAWAQEDRDAGGDGIDAATEVARAMWAYDPDVVACRPPEAKRVNGVPEEVAKALQPHEEALVYAGRVIACPQAPLAVARWLVRRYFTDRRAIPGAKRPYRAWMPTLVRIDQTWYEYASAAKDDPPRWVARTDPEWLRARLQHILGRYFYLKGRQENGQTVYDLVKSWNPDSQKLKLVEDALAGLLRADGGTAARELPDLYGWQCHGYPTAGTWVLCRNGVLDVTTGQMRPNTPMWFSLSRIEADYDHAADPYVATRWLAMLRAQWADDPGAITCLQQWFGYVVSGRSDLQKWMLTVGPSGSGKSIVADVLGALTGVVASVKLDDLNSAFGLQELYETGAQLALMSDIRFSTRDSSTAVGNLLAVTGEDTVPVARKYKTTVSAKLAVRFHGSANEIPRWSDNSAALQRRALILETTRGFRGTPSDDPGLKTHIISRELGAVLRWAVEGLALLDAAGGVFTRTSKAKELADDMDMLASPVRQFVAECCEIGAADDFVDLPDLFRVWGKWAGEKNTGRGMSQNKFRAAVKALYLDPVRPGQKQMPDGQRGKWSVVYGIKRAVTTYTERGQYGTEVRRTVATDGKAGDPMASDLN